MTAVKWMNFALVTFLAGCGTEAEDCHNTFTCPPPADACADMCVPPAPSQWDPPVLAWLGADAVAAPACPSSTTFYPSDKWEAPPAPPVCGTCSCDPPTGSCALPILITANSDPCAAIGPTTVQTPFDPPSPWDGSCTTMDAIPQGQVDSLTIPPLTLAENACVPSLGAIPQTFPTVTVAVTCVGSAFGQCPSDGDVCTPLAATPEVPGSGVWTYCIVYDGKEDPSTVACPTSYPDLHVFASGYDDARTCAACTCGAPEGSTCTDLISVYSDATCSSLLDVATATSTAPICHDVPPGSALAGKTAGVATYTPGACPPSGGGLTGSANPINPVALCCLN